MLTQFVTVAQTSMEGMDYAYESGVSTSGDDLGPASMAIMLVIFLVALVAGIATVAGLWKTFQKAGRPGWAAIIPVYNNWTQFEIGGKPGWWAVLAFVPIVNLIAIYHMVMAIIETSRRFGKDTGFALLMIFVPFIGYPMLGFGKSQYQAPTGSGPTPPSPAPIAVAAPVTPTAPATPSATRPPAPRRPRLIQ